MTTDKFSEVILFTLAFRWASVKCQLKIIILNHRILIVPE